jgi:serine phosphatase RsbU (regulator of sigma subunit)
MDRLHVRHLPVVEADHVVGVVTSRDLMARTNEHLNQAVEERTQELRRANERLRERDNELRVHMNVAGKIQSRLLPKKPPSLPEIDLAAHYEPLDPLGGDYYDFSRPDDRHLGILIADATGHSIPAALIAIMARTAFATFAPTNTSPAAVLTQMNRQLAGLTGDHFVTAFYAVFDRQTRVLRFANAGQPYPFHCRPGAAQCQPLVAHGLMLGIMEESDYEEMELQLLAGDRIVFYTDGLPDCLDERQQLFGAARIESLLRGWVDQSPQSITQRMADQVAAFRGQRPASDDLTILAAAVR